MNPAEAPHSSKQLLRGLQNYPTANARPEWMSEWQVSEAAWFQQKGFPTRKDEGWKYINLESILETAFAPSPAVNQIHVQAEVVQKYLLGNQDQADVLLINGQWVSHSKRVGVSITPLANAIASNRENVQNILTQNWEQKNSFTAMNNAYFHDGALITVAVDTALDHPVHIVHLMTTPENKSLVFFPRIVVQIQNGAQANVLYTEVDLGSTRFFNNQVIDVSLEANSKLNWVTVQRGGTHGINLSTLRVTQDLASEAHFTCFSTKGAITRNEVIAQFAGTDAKANFNGIALQNGESQTFQHLYINHAVPRCVGRQLFKNIVNDRARTEYNSLVNIARDAIHSDSGQLNRNMVLSKTARAWTRPQLQVYCDDVKAAHGATIGQVSPEELFYLRSRGLSEAAARAMLIYGFVEEVVMNIQNKELRNYVEAFLKTDLDEVVQSDNHG